MTMEKDEMIPGHADPREENHRPGPPSLQDMTVTAAYEALRRQARRLARRTHPRPDSTDAPLRAAGILLAQAPLLLDVRCWRALLRFAAVMRLPELLADLFAGRHVNVTEDRPALHHLARAHHEDLIAAAGRLASVQARKDAGLLADTRAQMQALAEALHTERLAAADGGPIQAILHIGIGGSHLGPEAAWQALAPDVAEDRRIPVHFLSNLDGSTLTTTLARLTPARTLVIVASKSFTTVETMTLWQAVRGWLGAELAAPEAQALAVTARPDRAAAAGFARERMLIVPQSIGGRFSLTSAFGAPIALGLGWETFSSLLAGARAMDDHVATAPAAENLAFRMALAGFWMKAVRRVAGEVVVPYADRLDLFIDHLQQLDLESNGKRVAAADGRGLPWPSAAALWGRRGTNAQHAFFEMLHQGTRDQLITLIGIRPGWSGRMELDRALLANLIGQAAAFLRGRSRQEAEAALEARGLDARTARRLAPHLVLPGARPHRILLLDRLDAFHFGALLALFEHRTVLEGWLYGINPFDQWGVERGKELAGMVNHLLQDEAGMADLDPVHAAILDAVSQDRR